MELINCNLEDKEKKAIDILKKQYGLKIETACFATDWIPKYLILDRTRNIHSYIVFFFEDNEKIISRYSSYNTSFINILRRLSEVQYSQLDRPLFLFYFDKYFKLRTTEIEIIKQSLFENKISQSNFQTYFDDSILFPQTIKQQL